MADESMAPLTTDLSPLQLVSSSKIYDNIYASEDTTRSAGISVYSNGLVFEQSGTTTSMGSVVTLTIPNVALLNTVYLNLRLDIPNTNGVNLKRGWGFQAIDRISWRIGSSSSYEFDGMTNFLAAMTQCETREKAEAILDAGGNPRFLVSAGVYSWTNNVAVVPLCVVPFSTTANDVLPFDSSLLNSPIQITVTLKSAGAFELLNIVNAHANNAPATAGAALPVGSALVNSYQDVYFTNEQNLFENSKADSLRMDMMANPVLINSYPYLFYQTATPIDYTASNTDFVNINLLSFRRANLVGIVLMPVFNSGYLQYNQNRQNDFTELQLSLNGQYTAKFRSFSGMQTYLARKQNKNPSYNIGKLEQGTAPLDVGNVEVIGGEQNLLVYIPMAQDITTAIHHEYHNGVKIQNQVLQLQVKNESATATRLHVVYVYNSAIFSQNSNADIVF
jgi:hypothetical protein